MYIFSALCANKLSMGRNNTVRPSAVGFLPPVKMLCSGGSKGLWPPVWTAPFWPAIDCRGVYPNCGWEINPTSDTVKHTSPYLGGTWRHDLTVWPCACGLDVVGAWRRHPNAGKLHGSYSKYCRFSRSRNRLTIQAQQISWKCPSLNPNF